MPSPSLLTNVDKAVLEAHFDEKTFPAKIFPDIFPYEISPTLEFTTLLGSGQLPVAATIVPFNSKAPVNTRPTFGTVTNNLGAIRVSREMDEKKFEEMDQLEDLFRRNPDQAVKDRMFQLIYNDPDYVVDSCGTMIDYLAVHTLFNQVIVLNDDNNPKGMKTANAIDFQLAADHKRAIEVTPTGTRVWSVGNKATMLPLTDMKTIKQTANDAGYESNWCWMNQSRFDIFSQSDEVIQNVFKGQVVPALLLSPRLEVINAYLRSENLPQIIVINTRIRFENKDGSFTTLDPTLTPDLGPNSDRYVIFTQEIKQGVTKFKPTMESRRQIKDATYATAENILVAKYAEGNPLREQTVGSINAFPSFPTIDSLYRLNTIDEKANGISTT